MKNEAIITSARAVISAILSRADIDVKDMDLDQTAFARKGAPDELVILGEHQWSGLFADYYCEWMDEDIHEDLQAWADENDLLLEWETPGAIRIYRN